MMKPKREVDVLILIEHAARELDIACALRWLGRARHGLSIEIASLAYDVARTLDTYAPRIVATPFFYSAEDWGVRDYLSGIEGATWVNLAFEQMISELNRKVKLPHDPVSREAVVHLAAGDFYRDELHDACVTTENVKTIGSLACCQYTEPYRAYFAVDKRTIGAAHGLDPEKPWLFYPENFAAAFFSQQLIDEKVRQGFDREGLRRYCEYSRACFEETIPWCWQAAPAHDIELIVRPRPAHPGQAFREACEKVAGGPPPPNLHFIKEGGIREWIFASDVVVSTYSTALIEAVVAGKPTWLLQPIPMPDALSASFFSAVPKVATGEHFLKLAGSCSSQKMATELLEWARENLLSHGDALENAVQVFAEICHGVYETPTIRHNTLTEAGVTPVVRPREPGLLTRASDQMRSLFGRPAPLSPHEADDFTREAIEARTDRWSEFLDAQKPPAACDEL